MLFITVIGEKVLLLSFFPESMVEGRVKGAKALLDFGICFFSVELLVRKCFLSVPRQQNEISPLLLPWKIDFCATT